MLPTPTPQLVVVNESTQVDAKWTWNAAYVLAYQLRWQAGPLLKLAAEVHTLEPGKPIPPDAWVLHLIDRISQAEGAIGFHDEDGNQVPYAQVGIEDALNNNLQPSEVLSHEGLELLYDAHCNGTAFDPKSGRLYPMELCDPVQGFSYDLGAPYNRKTGWIVSDFVLGNWFDPNTPATAKTNYRGQLTGPFTLGPQGYLNYTTTLPPDWQQEYGAHADRAIVGTDERVLRRVS